MADYLSVPSCCAALSDFKESQSCFLTLPHQQAVQLSKIRGNLRGLVAINSSSSPPRSDLTTPTPSSTSRLSIPPSCASSAAMSSSCSTPRIRCAGGDVATDTWASSRLNTSSPFTTASDPTCQTDTLEGSSPPSDPWLPPSTASSALVNIWGL